MTFHENRLLALFFSKIRKDVAKFVLIGALRVNAGPKYCRTLQGEHSAILWTFIKLPFVYKIRSLFCLFLSGRLKNSGYDQEIPQSQTTDSPVAP